jgi:hypothetical protein
VQRQARSRLRRPVAASACGDQDERRKADEGFPHRQHSWVKEECGRTVLPTDCQINTYGDN